MGFATGFLVASGFLGVAFLRVDGFVAAGDLELNTNGFPGLVFLPVDGFVEAVDLELNADWASEEVGVPSLFLGGTVRARVARVGFLVLAALALAGLVRPLVGFVVPLSRFAACVAVFAAESRAAALRGLARCGLERGNAARIPPSGISPSSSPLGLSPSLIVPQSSRTGSPRAARTVRRLDLARGGVRIGTYI